MDHLTPDAERYSPEILALLNTGPYWTIAQAAARFGLQIVSLRRYVGCGRIPARQLPVADIPAAIWHSLGPYARATIDRRGWIWVVTDAVMEWYLRDRHPSGRHAARRRPPPPPD